MSVTQEADEAPLKGMFSSPPVTIKVINGSKSEVYFVHKDLLMNYSAVFKGAFESEQCKEHISKEVVFEDIECSTMGRFVDWLYTGSIPSHEEEDEAQHGSPEKANMIDLIKLCALAHRFFVSVLEEDVVRAAEYCLYPDDDTAIVPTCEIVTFAYDHLPDDHEFLKLLVSSFCHGWNKAKDGWGPEQFKELPSKFLFQVTVKFAEDAQTSEDKMKKLDRKARKYYPWYANCINAGYN